MATAPKDASTSGKADGDTNKKSGPEDTPPAAPDPAGPQTVEDVETNDQGAPMQAPTLATPDALKVFDNLDREGLRAEAKAQGVEINYDVEKAHLVAALRRKWTDEHTAGDGDKVPLYDLMSLDDLRKAASAAKVEPFTKNQEQGHLQTELRAHRTGAPATADPGKGATHSHR